MDGPSDSRSSPPHAVGSGPPRSILGLPSVFFVIAALLGVLLGIGAFTFHYAEGFSYFSTDPEKNCEGAKDEAEGSRTLNHLVEDTGSVEVSPGKLYQWV